MDWLEAEKIHGLVLVLLGNKHKQARPQPCPTARSAVYKLTLDPSRYKNTLLWIGLA